jgi:hypothetical protein
MHIPDRDRCNWLRERIETPELVRSSCKLEPSNTVVSRSAVFQPQHGCRGASAAEEDCAAAAAFTTVCGELKIMVCMQLNDMLCTGLEPDYGAIISSCAGVRVLLAASGF